MKLARQRTNRKAAVAAFMALLLIPMLALVALCVDYGYLLVVKTDLQRAADATALAAVRDLVPDADGSQNFDEVRSTIRSYAAANLGMDQFTVRDQDITIGRYDPATIYTTLEIRNDGIFDTVQITLRRDNLANNPVSLFFARIIGFTESTVTATATAVLQKAQNLPPGTDILPIAIPENEWDMQTFGQDWSVYGDGKILDDDGNQVPGNFGTVDIGATNNSTRALSRQIRFGLYESDIDSLNSDGRTSNPEYIGGNEQFWAQADTGLSSGIKSAVTENHGNTKLVPIIQGTNGGNGNNLEYLVVGWGAVQIVDSHWQGGPSNRHLTVKKAYMYDEDLKPAADLSETVNIIDAVYTSPVLVWPVNPVPTVSSDDEDDN